MCEYPIGNGLVSSLYLKTLSVEEGFLSSAIIKKAGCFYSSSGALIQKICSLMSRFWFVAGATGFEPAISALTGPHVEPLHHAPIGKEVYHRILLRQVFYKRKRWIPPFSFSVTCEQGLGGCAVGGFFCCVRNFFNVLFEAV